ncbi:MAG: hypothetical protein IKW35_09345 [Paludibacteraceae bacterium]|nr:hypothetical protein [Paludibacteraceae bacterium]
MKKIFMAVVALMMTISASAQFYIYYSDGTVAKVDSISMVAPKESVHEYVDLGLSVKWATCNVGANSPEEYGDCFAWGETQPKETYDWSTYKWYNGSSGTQIKYCTNRYFGNVDNKTVLEASDDAATANWGGAWRMPTKAEQDELCTECTWKRTTQNGVIGYKVTGANGNSIFLPVTGYPLEYGNYWSSSLDTDYPDYAYRLFFDSSGRERTSNFRCYGLYVRPVCP